MSSGRFWLLYGLGLASMMGAVAVWIVTLTGAPPRHCRYMVPIENKPGIYGCSEYPQARTKP